MEINLNTPLSEITIGDLIKIFETIMQRELRKHNNMPKMSESKYAFGIKGIAETLGCSISQAKKIKSSGKLNGAIYQEKKGNGIVIDREVAREIYFNQKTKL